ncbi:MAG: 50S ribosome-binding GTPase, partial [Clostridia bacterium]|nr:50S ribosome-binding GTPase [Clostridia bacterium]
MRHFFSTSDRYINEYDFKIALMGNPNVGKSTIFNALTGMNQHTGNWPGKTVSSADGYCKSEKYLYKLIDLPGTYSLMAHSPEEEIARDFVCFEKPDAAIIVCDATCLERNLNLALQINETGIPLLICINLMDEAERKGIKINTDMLEEKLCVPIIKTVGKKKSSAKALLSALDKLCENKKTSFYEIEYPYALEKEINSLAASFKENKSMLQSRF